MKKKKRNIDINTLASYIHAQHSHIAYQICYNDHNNGNESKTPVNDIDKVRSILWNEKKRE